jgi:NTE family protein
MASSRVALVLAGGASRGAYEVGVISHIVKDVAKAIGRDVPLDIICGTSVGAINACVMAAHADEPSGRADRLAKHWLDLKLETMVRPSSSQFFSMLGGLIGRKTKDGGEGARGGLLDPSGIEEIVHKNIPFDRIRGHLNAGRLSALTISTTHVASGHTVVFVQRKEPGLPPWGQDPTLIVAAAEMTAEHARASAAIPLLFPAVRIGDQFYCDGGLRQNVPLSPARRLGAHSFLVVNPRFIEATPLSAPALPSGYPGPFFLLGKALNALLLDRIDNDIDRLKRINAIFDAGTRRYGPTFVDAINEELGQKAEKRKMRSLRLLHIRASENIGAIAADYVQSAKFAARAPGWLGRTLRRIGDREGAGESDLLSYLLFDGEFAGRLIELGRKDARAKHDELCAFFEEPEA